MASTDSEYKRDKFISGLYQALSIMTNPDTDQETLDELLEATDALVEWHRRMKESANA